MAAAGGGPASHSSRGGSGGNGGGGYGSQGATPGSRGGGAAAVPEGALGGAAAASAAAVTITADATGGASIGGSGPVGRRYRLADPRALPPLRGGPPAPFWDIQSAEDAGALLSGCPLDCVVCCGFSAPYADGMKAQAAALEELAAAVPAGFVFATVDIKASPEVANWAGVSSPMVRLLEPDGRVVAEVRSTDVAKGALHQAVLSHAAVIAKAAEPKLEALAQKYPKALHAEAVAMPAGTDCEKMRQRGLESLDRFGARSADTEAFTALCSCCVAGSSRTPRVREVASLAKSLRQLPIGDVLPLLDLARRLAARKLLAGGEPGTREALELLLDAALCRGLEDESVDLTRASLAVQFVSNCLLPETLREALLPVVGQLVSADGWLAAWSPPDGTPAAAVSRSRDAAASLLLNASVALRRARCRAENAGLLQAATVALQALPENERLNLACGNLLAVGGGAEEAKRVLQAQPLPPLRSLAAAVFRGDLADEESRAFPEVWRPRQPPPGGGDEGGGGRPAGNRRPGAVPARARRRLGGG